MNTYLGRYIHEQAGIYLYTADLDAPILLTDTVTIDLGRFNVTKRSVRSLKFCTQTRWPVPRPCWLDFGSAVPGSLRRRERGGRQGGKKRKKVYGLTGDARFGVSR